MFHDPNVDSLIGAFVRPCSWLIGERATVQQVIGLHFLEPSHLLLRVPIVRKSPAGRVARRFHQGSSGFLKLIVELKQPPGSLEW